MAENEKNSKDDCAKINTVTYYRTIGKKTLESYKHGYNNFMAWKSRKKYPSDLCTEKVFLEYFTEISKTLRPVSLWNMFSKLRHTVNEYHGLDIKKYVKLTQYLRKCNDGYTSPRRTVLSSQDIKRFLQEAPDYKYLVMKVVLIFSMNGPYSRDDIANVHAKDVEEHGEILLVKMKHAQRKRDDKTPRSFIIRGKCCQIVKKYMDLRVKDGSCERFLQNYHNGRCTRQPIGIHKIGKMPKEVARFLKLPNPEKYKFMMTSAVAHKQINNGHVLLELDRDVACGGDGEEGNETAGDQPDTEDDHPGSDEDDNECLSTLTKKSNTTNGVKPSESDLTESKNEDSNSETNFSPIEISLPPLDGIKREREVSPSHEDPLSRSTTNIISPDSSDISENTAYRNDIIQGLDQSVKMSDKNLTFIFKHCNFTNCFNK